MLRSRVKFAHKTLVLNEHYTDADPPVHDLTKDRDTITVDRLLIRPQFRDTRDPLHLGQGGTPNKVHKGFLLLQMAGRILVPAATQQKSLTDREMALRAALDPYECWRDDPTTEGVYALDWLEPTADADYASGWVPLRRYARPLSQPETVWAVTDAAVREWSCGLFCPDPRLYEQTLGSLTASAAGPATLTNRGSIPGPLRVTITMSGAGNNNFTIARGGVSFVLDLSGMVNADVVEVVMETCGPFGIGRSVKKNGVAAFALKTSGPATWLDVPPGTTAFAHTNTTNIASVLYEWGHARP